VFILTIIENLYTQNVKLLTIEVGVKLHIVIILFGELNTLLILFGSRQNIKEFKLENNALIVHRCKL
jgi:hypothetical protein